MKGEEILTMPLVVISAFLYLAASVVSYYSLLFFCSSQVVDGGSPLCALPLSSLLTPMPSFYVSCWVSNSDCLLCDSYDYSS